MLRLLLVSMLLLAASVGVGAAGEEGPGERKTFDAARWRETIDKFKAQDAEAPPPAEAVLFVGSSTIRNWEIDRMFDGMATINRGFGGSKIPDVLHYMDEIVLPYEPRVVVFYCGDNDIAARQPPRYVAEDFQTFADRTFAALPQTHIVLLAIKPSVKRWSKWPAMAEANRMVAEICEKDERLTYLDLSDTVLNERGEPDPQAFSDGLHLSEATYEVWTQRVKQALAEIEKVEEE